jgi:hypothetical protein
MEKESTYRLTGTLSGLLNTNHRQRISESKFIIEPNLDVINTVLLKLYAAQHVDIRNIGIQCREGEFQLTLSYGLLVVAAKNKRLLNKLSGAAAPSRPKAKLKESNRQCMSGDHPEDPNQRLLSANLGPDVLAGYRGLQVRRDYLGHVSE